MAYKRFRIVLSKGWTLLVCTFSVAVLALTVSCRSKKVNKQAEPEPSGDEPPREAEDVNIRRSADDLAPMLTLPGDSKEVKDMINQVNSLKDELSGRMSSVIYGPPEVMQRRAQENRDMRARIDSLSNEINKARNK
ncbi:MAG: hypothetical protein IKW84_08380 [Bacteroidaceae bacterium]|nr:hypothetical protein [Bacteroidaceae bacterium]